MNPNHRYGSVIELWFNLSHFKNANAFHRTFINRFTDCINNRNSPYITTGTTIDHKFQFHTHCDSVIYAIYAIFTCKIEREQKYLAFNRAG